MLPSDAVVYDPRDAPSDVIQETDPPEIGQSSIIPEPVVGIEDIGMTGADQLLVPHPPPPPHPLSCPASRAVIAIFRRV